MGLRRIGRAQVLGGICATVVITVYHPLDWSFITLGCCLLPVARNPELQSLPEFPQISKSKK